MTPLTGDAKPYPKDKQLVRGERRAGRKIASAKKWSKIVDAKQGPCRCSTHGRCAGTITYHHVVPRAPWSGDDIEDNIVPICDQHHREITARNQTACRTLLASLTDAEYAYALNKTGEDFFERAYGLVYERVT